MFFEICEVMNWSDNEKHKTMTGRLRSGDGHFDTENRPMRRRTGAGNERRDRTDSAEGHILQEIERKGDPRTEQKLIFYYTAERLQADTGTTNDVGNPDESIIDLVGDKDIRGTKRRAEGGRINTGGR